METVERLCSANDTVRSAFQFIGGARARAPLSVAYVIARTVVGAVAICFITLILFPSRWKFLKCIQKQTICNFRSDWLYSTINDSIWMLLLMKHRQKKKVRLQIRCDSMETYRLKYYMLLLKKLLNPIKRRDFSHFNPIVCVWECLVKSASVRLRVGLYF